MAQSLEYTDCFLADCTIVKDPQSIQFGFIEVPENHDKPQGRHLRLAFVVIKAKKKFSNKVPILYLSGGPGVISLADVAKWEDHYLRAERDIVLTDFRGIGYSEPELCPELNAQMWEIFGASLTPSEEARRKRAVFQNCFSRLYREGWDLNQYNSAAIVKDLELLRKDLDLPYWNLLSISYGTRMAQTYIRDAPGGLRSVILDSTFPMGSEKMKHPLHGYHRSLNLFFTKCATNPDCSERFPNLKKDFFKAMENLRPEPVEIPSPGLPGETFFINSQDAHLMFFQFLKQGSNYPALPYLIEALLNREIEVFENMIGMASEQNGRVSMAMGILVNKYDNHFGPKQLSKFDMPLPLDALAYFDAEYTVLEAMDFIHLESKEKQKVFGNTPVLILAGECDPITPPEYGLELLGNFPKSYFFSFPYSAHGVFRQEPCSELIINNFFRNPDQNPRANCPETVLDDTGPFTAELFENYRISSLLRGVIVQKNWLLVSPVLLLVLSWLVGCYRFWAYRAYPFDQLWLGVATVGIIILLGFGWFFYATFRESRLLLLFGLLPSANAFFVLSYLYFGGFGLLLLIYLRNLWMKDGGPRITYWGLMLIFLGCFAHFLWSFQLYPN